MRGMMAGYLIAVALMSWGAMELFDSVASTLRPGLDLLSRATSVIP